ncbi:MAG: FecR domain-containing protein [Acidobacteriota bacterium]
MENLTKRRRGSGAFNTEWFVISKKTIWRAIGALIGLVVLTGAFFLVKYLLSGEPPQEDNRRAARISFLDGAVMVKRANASAPERATLNMVLEPGDTIQTSSGASAVVQYVDGSVCKIKPGSTIILRENNTKDDKTQVANEVTVGIVNVSTHDKSTYRIDTPNTRTLINQNSTATVGSDGQKDFVVTSNGTVKVTPLKGGEPQMLGANERVDVSGSEVKRSSVLPSPGLTNPPNGKPFVVDKNSEIEFAWQPVAGAGHYRLEVSSTPSFPEKALVINDAGINGTSYKWVKPVDGSYFWRVQALDQEGREGNWSDSPNFTVKVKTQNRDIPIKITNKVEIGYLLVTVEGITKPGVMLRINENPVPVDAKGNFKKDVSFPANTPQRTLVLEAFDNNGNTGKLIDQLPIR